MNQLTARFTAQTVESLTGPTNKVSEIQKYGEQVALAAVYSNDPTNPNYSYSQATPCGAMQMTITNTGAFDFFVPGKEYDLIIRPVADTVEIEDLARQYITAPAPSIVAQVEELYSQESAKALRSI